MRYRTLPHFIFPTRSSGTSRARRSIGCGVLTLATIGMLPAAGGNFATAEDTTVAASEKRTAKDDTAKDDTAKDDLAEVIRADIDDAESLSVDEITVGSEDGLVTLSGTVASLMDKRRAADVAKRVRGVQAVLNEIIVQPTSRSDADIREDVVSRMKTNDSLEKLEIVAAVNGGEVALTGKVDSLAEKRVAERAAAGVRGVTSVANQLTVRLDPDRSDQELREEVNALIIQSVYLDDLNIDVNVKDAVVTLAGKVHSAAQKERLEAVAEIWGVQKVDVEGVEVQPDSVDQTVRKRRYADVSDQQISQAIRRSLSNHPIAFSAVDQIQPEVHDGVVTLQGTVSRLRVKEIAERLAMDVVGVHRVVNELEVQYDQTPYSDAEIIDLTQKALELSPYLYRRDFRVHCNRAHVTLYGAVESQLEKEIAGWIAGGIPSVVHVNNVLAVEKPQKDKSDEQIKQDLQRKLKYSFYDKADRIQVRVVDGVAILSGTVDTWRQWQMALDLAIEAGSRTPHNMIDVRFHPPHGASDAFVPR
ncbi:BON domain-containing protein [Roseiconus nitratireducens]|nr:BON domain-containing protein [Roseiconus nitratireducens]